MRADKDVSNKPMWTVKLRKDKSMDVDRHLVTL